MLSDTEFTAEEKELKHYTDLAQKQLDRYIQKVQALVSCKQKKCKLIQLHKEL